LGDLLINLTAEKRRNQERKAADILMPAAKHLP
jgi:hypothetical protein